MTNFAINRLLPIIMAATFLMSSALTSSAMEDAIEVLKQTSKAFNSVARDSMPAVVFIEIEADFKPSEIDEDQLDDIEDEWLRRFFKEYYKDGNRRRFQQSGQGTGFIVSDDGYILTNAHIVDSADRLKVILSDGTRYDARKIGSDSRSDVALIKIDPDVSLPTVKIGNSENLEIGEWAIAIGNPFGLTATLTVGVISAVGRNNIGIADYENFIQTDAAINPGNSGGPLLNIDGEVIGMNTAIYSRTGGSMGVGFSIPINMVMAIKNQLQERGKVIRGFLGIVISDIDEDAMEELSLEKAFGIRIDRIMDDSAAAEAGLEIDDVIVTLNGKSIRNVAAFRNRVAMMPPGTDLKLKVVRKGKTRTIKATTGVHPDEQIALRKQEAVDKIGLEVGPLDPETAEAMGFKAKLKGMLITSVEADSTGAEAGLEPGQVIISINRKAVKTKKDYTDALDKAIEAGTIMLRIRDAETYRLITIEPGE